MIQRTADENEACQRLVKIPGIGPVKRRRLLQEFGSIQGVREASEEAIAKVPGFNAAQAKKLLESLAATSPVA